MRKKIAVLEVWVDSENTNSCALQFVERKDGEEPEVEQYRLMLHPNEKLKGVHENHSTRDNLISVLAHELGHFVANLVETPLFKEMTALRRKAKEHFGGHWEQIMHSSKRAMEMVVREETEAWDIGEQIRSDLNREYRQESLDTYLATQRRAKLP